MASSFDILGLGCVALDDLLYVASYPPPDTKTPVERRERQCGGLTATALVAAARLGCRCAYAGTLGDDDLSRFVIDRLRQEGIDVSAVRQCPGARPIHSLIIVDESRQTRTIFYDVHNVLGARPDWPGEQLIRSARILFVDHWGIEGMLRAAGIAREAGIPVVADFENDQVPGFAELLNLADHLIVSEAFARKITREASVPAAVKKLQAPGRNAVVVTCGGRGCWYLDPSAGGEPAHQHAFAVPVVDTTGCGDVFHGAYAAALARDLPFRDRIRFASAAAALKATQRGGQAGSPTRAAVEAFLKEHSP